MQDIHTSREKLNIASVRRTWEFLLEVMKAF
jgi:di/tripeptidase